jgi:hypothetical protein
MEASGLAPDVFVGQRRAAQAVQVQEAQLPGQLRATEMQIALRQRQDILQAIPYDRNLPAGSTLPGEVMALQNGRREALQTVTPENRAAVEQENFRQETEILAKYAREVQSRGPQQNQQRFERGKVDVGNGQFAYFPDQQPGGVQPAPIFMNPPKARDVYDFSKPGEFERLQRDSAKLQAIPGYENQILMQDGTWNPREDWRESPIDRKQKLMTNALTKLISANTSTEMGERKVDTVAVNEGMALWKKEYDAIEAEQPQPSAAPSGPSTQPTTMPAGTRPLPVSPDQMVVGEKYAGPNGLILTRTKDGLVLYRNPVDGKWYPLDSLATTQPGTVR